MTFGYHEAERDFGRWVRDSYLKKFGELENVLFQEINAGEDIPGGTADEKKSREIAKIQECYRPSLTIDIHHSTDSRLPQRNSNIPLVLTTGFWPTNGNWFG